MSEATWNPMRDYRSANPAPPPSVSELDPVPPTKAERRAGDWLISLGIAGEMQLTDNDRKALYLAIQDLVSASAALRAQVETLAPWKDKYGQECDAMQAFVKEHDIGGAAGYGHSVFDLVRADLAALRAQVETLTRERDEALKTLDAWDRAEVLRDIAWCVERSAQLFHNRKLGIWRLAYFPGGEEMWKAADLGLARPQDPTFLDVPAAVLGDLSRPEVAIALVRIAREGPNPPKRGAA